MHKLSMVTAWVLIVCFGLVGCATTGGQTTWSSPEACIAGHTVGGAALGALVGAAIGSLTGGGKGAGKGAIAGGVGGAVIGFAYAWGKCFASFSKVESTQVKNYDETAREVGYSPNKGVDVKINEYALDPSAVKPGGEIKFDADYYVMVPPDSKEVSVTETRILKVYDEEKKQFVELEPVNETKVVSPGLRRADGSFPIPDSAPDSKFILVFKVTAEGKTDSLEMPFMITKDKQLLAKAEAETAKRKTKNRNWNNSTTLAASSNNSPSAAGEKSVATAGEKYIVITSEKATLRENPDPHSKVISSAKRDEQYPLITTVTVGGKKWYQIRIADGRTPWISGSLSKVVGE